MKKIISISFVLIFIFEFSYAQKKKLPSIEIRIDSILKKRPETYKEINDIIRPFRKDTAQLRYIIQRFDEEELFGRQDICTQYIGYEL